MRLYFFFALFLLSSIAFSQKAEDMQSLAKLLVKELPDTLQLNHHEQTAFSFSTNGVTTFEYEHTLNKHVAALLQANNHLFAHENSYGLYLFVDPITSRRIINLSEKHCGNEFITHFVNVAVERGFFAFRDSLLKDWNPVIHDADLFNNGKPKQVDIFINKVGEATFFGDDVLVRCLHAAREPFWKPGIYYGAPINNVQMISVFPSNSVEKDRIQYGELAFVVSERFESKFLKFDYDWRGEIDQKKHTAVSFIYNPARGEMTDPTIHADEHGDAGRLINWITTNYGRIKDDFVNRFNWSSRYLFYID